MTNKTFAKARKVFTVAVLAILATIGVAIRPAHATMATCPPSLIEVSSNTLIVQCAPTNYYGVVTPPTGCSDGQTLDTLKMWQALAQGAVLSGKSMQIYFVTCGGENIVYALDLVK